MPYRSSYRYHCWQSQAISTTCHSRSKSRHAGVSKLSPRPSKLLKHKHARHLPSTIWSVPNVNLIQCSYKIPCARAASTNYVAWSPVQSEMSTCAAPAHLSRRNRVSYDFVSGYVGLLERLSEGRTSDSLHAFSVVSQTLGNTRDRDTCPHAAHVGGTRTTCVPSISYLSQTPTSLIRNLLPR
jgi:hypothetical protein